jgi:hypothetical protein
MTGSFPVLAVVRAFVVNAFAFVLKRILSQSRMLGAAYGKNFRE